MITRVTLECTYDPNKAVDNWIVLVSAERRKAKREGTVPIIKIEITQCFQIIVRWKMRRRPK